MTAVEKAKMFTNQLRFTHGRFKNNIQSDDIEAMARVIAKFREVETIILDSVENTDSDWDYEMAIERCYEILKSEEVTDE